MRIYQKTVFQLCVALAVLGMPLQATAQDRLIAQYVADIGPEDHFNSSGKALTTFAALLAQDRANYHRFGIRHQNDGSDPLFSNRSARAQIGPSTVRISPSYQGYVNNILSTRPGGTYFVVSVYGQGASIFRITIDVPG